MSLAVIAGVGLANSAAGSFLTALGLVLQQQANVRRQEKTHAQYAYAQPGVYAAEATNSASRVPLSDPQYLAGLGCVMLGATSSIFCDGLLPQSTLAPLTCQTIVYKILLGRVLLKEEVTTVTWVALSLMVTGMVVSVCGANLYDGSYTLATLLDLFLQPTALLYTVLSGLVLFVLRRVLKHVLKNDFSTWMGLGYLTLASGMIAGWTGTLIKALVELTITATTAGARDFRHVGTYVFVVLLPWLVSIKLKYVSIGLKHFSTDVFMPLYQATVIGCCAVSGVFYYLDFDVLEIEEEEVEYEEEIESDEWTGGGDEEEEEEMQGYSGSESSASFNFESSRDFGRDGNGGGSGVSGSIIEFIAAQWRDQVSDPAAARRRLAAVLRRRVLKNQKSKTLSSTSYATNGATIARSAGSNITVYSIGCAITVAGVLLMLKRKERGDGGGAGGAGGGREKGAESKTYGEFLSTDDSRHGGGMGAANAIDGGGVVYGARTKQFSAGGAAYGQYSGGYYGQHQHQQGGGGGGGGGDSPSYAGDVGGFGGDFYGGFGTSSGVGGDVIGSADFFALPPAGGVGGPAGGSTGGQGAGATGGAGGAAVGCSGNGGGGEEDDDEEEDPAASASLLGRIGDRIGVPGAGGFSLSNSFNDLAAGAGGLVGSLTGAAAGVAAPESIEQHQQLQHGSHHPLNQGLASPQHGGAAGNFASGDFAAFPPGMEGRAPPPPSFTSAAAAGMTAQRGNRDVLEL